MLDRINASGVVLDPIYGWARCNRLLGGVPQPTLLGRRRTNDNRPAAGARKRYAIASDSLVD